MIRHIVYWELKPEADGRSALENAKRMKEGAAAMLGQIPSLKAIEVSYIFLPSTSVSAKVILQSTHDDAAGLQAYAVHPVHVEYAKMVGTVAASREVIDYEV